MTPYERGVRTSCWTRGWCVRGSTWLAASGEAGTRSEARDEVARVVGYIFEEVAVESRETIVQAGMALCTQTEIEGVRDMKCGAVRLEQQTARVREYFLLQRCCGDIATYMCWGPGQSGLAALWRGQMTTQSAAVAKAHTPSCGVAQAQAFMCRLFPACAAVYPGWRPRTKLTPASRRGAVGRL